MALTSVPVRISESVDALSAELLDSQPIDRDWSEGWPEEWDWIKTPECPYCGKSEEQGYDWICPTRGCENFGRQIEDDLDGGPVMNYAYPLGEYASYDTEDALKIAHLPLVIVTRPGSYYTDTEYELALAGGGMDFSWQIAEAFMRLGFLPPLFCANLPAMAGRGAMTGGGKTDRRRISKRDRWIIAGCQRSFEQAHEIATARLESARRNLNRILGLPT